LDLAEQGQVFHPKHPCHSSLVFLKLRELEIRPFKLLSVTNHAFAVGAAAAMSFETVVEDGLEC